MNKARKQYLERLAEDFGLELDVVLEVAFLLGKEEDHDGLISTLEDLSWQVD